VIPERQIATDIFDGAQPTGFLQVVTCLGNLKQIVFYIGCFCGPLTSKIRRIQPETT
jgi:hypothetical protein